MAVGGGECAVEVVGEVGLSFGCGAVVEEAGIDTVGLWVGGGVHFCLGGDSYEFPCGGGVGYEDRRGVVGGVSAGVAVGGEWAAGVHIGCGDRFGAEIDHGEGGLDLAFDGLQFGLGDEFHQVVLVAFAVFDKVGNAFGEAVECGGAVVLVDFEVGAGEGGGEVVVPRAAVVDGGLDCEGECAVEGAGHYLGVVVADEG